MTVKLDFTKINEIGRGKTTENEEKWPLYGRNQSGNIIYQKDPETGLSGANSAVDNSQNEEEKAPIQPDSARFDKLQEIIAQARMAYHFYGQNTRAAEEDCTRILKGVRAGEDPVTLLLIASHAISSMTGNRLFYSQVSDDIKTIWGDGLERPAALISDLRETKERLSRLRSAEARAKTKEEAARIHGAIVAHKNRIAELETLLPKTKRA